jgi:hypothetical protein
MNWLVGTIFIMFVLFISAKGHLGQYMALLTYTPAAGSSDNSVPVTPTGPKDAATANSNAATSQNQAYQANHGLFGILGMTPQVVPPSTHEQNAIDQMIQTNKETSPFGIGP